MDKSKAMDLLFSKKEKKNKVKNEIIKKWIFTKQIKEKPVRVKIPWFVFFVLHNEWYYSIKVSSKIEDLIDWMRRKKKYSLVNCWRVEDRVLASIISKKKFKPYNE